MADTRKALGILRKGGTEALLESVRCGVQEQTLWSFFSN